MTADTRQPTTRLETVVGVAVIAAALATLAALVAHAAHHRQGPPVGPLVGFALVLVAATNLPVLLQHDVVATPDLMVVMVAVAAFRGPAGTLAVALIGFSGGLVWRVFSSSSRRRTLRGALLLTGFNCSQMLLAAAAASAVFLALVGRSVLDVLVAASAAALVHAGVNCVLMLVSMSSSRFPLGEVWADMRPVMPNFLAFGIVGVLVGQLYSMLGLLSLVLLIVPTVIARRTYRASLDLQEAHEATIRVFLRALDAKDAYTARHTHRVALYAGYIGEELGFKAARLAHLRHAALMHDIGKLAVSSALLNKPGRLTAKEYDEVRRHNEVCVEILSEVAFLRSTIPVASDRHGRFETDGEAKDPSATEGYIVAVADAFDAMTSTRAYRKALPHDVALDELRRGSGTQFHPACVDALIRALGRRGEVHGAGFETDIVDFDVEPPVTGVGSAGLGDLDTEATRVIEPSVRSMRREAG